MFSIKNNRNSATNSTGAPKNTLGKRIEGIKNIVRNGIFASLLGASASMAAAAPSDNSEGTYFLGNGFSEAGVSSISHDDAENILGTNSIVDAMKILGLNTHSSARKQLLRQLAPDIDIDQINKQHAALGKNVGLNITLLELLKREISSAKDSPVVQKPTTPIITPKPTSTFESQTPVFDTVEAETRAPAQTQPLVADNSGELSLSGNQSGANAAYTFGDTTVSGNIDNNGDARLGFGYSSQDRELFSWPANIDLSINYDGNGVNYSGKVSQEFENGGYVAGIRGGNNSFSGFLGGVVALDEEQNWFLNGQLSYLRKGGFTYEYPEFSDPSLVPGLSFGNSTQEYSITQYGGEIGLSYGNENGFLKFAYSQYRAANVLFDTRTAATRTGNLISTHDIYAGFAGYKIQQFQLAGEYMVNPGLQIRGNIGYQIADLNPLFNLDSETRKELIYGVGATIVPEKTWSIENIELAPRFDFDYTDSGFYRQADAKVTIGLPNSDLYRKYGISPYVGVSHIDRHSGDDSTTIEIGLTTNPGLHKPTRLTIGGLLRDMDHPVIEGPTNRIGREVIHTGTYNETFGTLTPNPETDNTHNYSISLSGLSLTGSFISNIPSLDQYIKVDNNSLTFVGVNRNFESIAGQEIRISLQSSNGGYYLLKIPTQQGSFNITESLIQPPSATDRFSFDAAKAFAQQIHSNYSGAEIISIFSSFFSGGITKETTNAIFDGSLRKEIVSEWLQNPSRLGNNVLNYIVANINNLDQNSIIASINDPSISVITIDIIDPAPDTTPNSFSLGNQTDVARGVSVSSNSISVSGINTAAPISITGGEYSINGGAFTNAAGSVNQGDTVVVRLTSSNDYETETSATLNIGGVQSDFRVTTELEPAPDPDTTPNSFDLVDQTDVARAASISSNSITVSGINTAAPISITGGEYSINGGAFTNVAGSVNQGDTVVVRLTSSNSYGTITSATLDIGGVQSDFQVMTEFEPTPDTTPNNFDFVDQTDVARGVNVSSNSITISGINTAAPISITGGEYSINGGAFTSAAGNVNQGDTVIVRLSSSNSYGTTTFATLDIGGVQSDFQVMTEFEPTPDPDTTPNTFSFTDQINVALNSSISSNPITISGINTAAPISITGGEYSINGGTFTSAAGSVNQGDTVIVRLTSSSSHGTPTSATLNVGGVSDEFSITTLTLADTTPDTFTFTDQTNAALNTVLSSNTINITGIDAAAPISITGGEYSINGGAFTSSAGSVNQGDTVVVRTTSSSNYGTITSATLNIGGVSDEFSITTLPAPDTTPDNFSFNSITGVTPNTSLNSNPINITGIDAPAPISITGGEYSINGGTFTSAAGNVNQGDTVIVRLTSANNYGILSSATLTVGGVSGTFSVTTLPNTAPVAQNFSSATAGTSGTISKSGEIDPNISDAEHTDSQLTINSVVGEVGKIASAVVNGSGGIDWSSVSGFEGNATISYKVTDGLLESNTGVITVLADRKGPEFTGHTINGLVSTGTTYTGLSISVSDLSGLSSMNLEFVDLSGNSVGGSFSNISISNNTATFDCVTPNLGPVQIRATASDAYGNQTTNLIGPFFLF